MGAGRRRGSAISYATRVTPALLGAIALMAGSAAATAVPPKAATAETQASMATAACQSHYPGMPCLGPIQSVYTFEGQGEGDDSYLKAHVGPSSKPTEERLAKPVPGEYEVTHRVASWQAAAGTELVAAYLAYFDRGKYPSYRKIPTGRLSGHATLEALKAIGSTPGIAGRVPLLYLEGRRIPGAPIPKPRKRHKLSPCPLKEAPCLGSIETLVPFNGRIINPDGPIHATLGPVEQVGTAPSGREISRRTVRWHSPANVQLAAAFIANYIRKGNGSAYETKRIPTGAHSGSVTLTTEPENHQSPEPLVLIEGRPAKS